MWSIARAEGVDSASFFGLEAIDVGFDDRVYGERAGLGDDQPSVDLVSVEASNEDAYVISCFSIVKGFIEGFDADGLGFEVFIVAIELDIVSNFDFTLFDSSTSHSASTGDTVGAFD